MFTVTNNIEALDNLYFEPCVRSESGGSVTVVTERRTGKEVPEQLSNDIRRNTHHWTSPNYLQNLKTWTNTSSSSSKYEADENVYMYTSINIHVQHKYICIDTST